MPYEPYEWPQLPPAPSGMEKVLSGDMMQFYAATNPTRFVRGVATGDVEFLVDGGDSDPGPDGTLPNIDAGVMGGLDGGGPGPMARDPHGLYRVIVAREFGSLDVVRVYDAGANVSGTTIRGCLLPDGVQTPAVDDVGVVKRTGDMAYTFVPIPGLAPTVDVLVPMSPGCLAWKGKGPSPPTNLAQWQDTVIGDPMRAVLSVNDAFGDSTGDPFLVSGFLVKYVTAVALGDIVSLDFAGEVGDTTGTMKRMYGWNGATFDLFNESNGIGRNSLVSVGEAPATYLIGGEIHVLYTHVWLGPTLSFYYGSVTLNRA